MPPYTRRFWTKYQKMCFFVKKTDQNHQKSSILEISITWFWPLIFFECKAFLLCNPVQEANENCNQLALRRFCSFLTLIIQIWGFHSTACQSTKNSSTLWTFRLLWKNAVGIESVAAFRNLVPVESDMSSKRFKMTKDQMEETQSWVNEVYLVQCSRIGTLLDLSDVKFTKP